jgi:predicted DNA-binding transcriptional regulator AlpA
MSLKEMTKVESANYIGVSRATFDNYISKGLIPKGSKRPGLNNLMWNKSDLDKYLKTK